MAGGGCGRRGPLRTLDSDAGVPLEVARDLPVTESFDELAPIFLSRKASASERALLWARYRGRVVRWSGQLASFTDNGATFRMSPGTATFDVSVQFESSARERLHRHRVGTTVPFVGRLSSYDDLWRSMYLVHGDLAAPGADAGR
jgi:hypothetical protein